MTWRMPAEGDPHERTWMAFPNAATMHGGTEAERVLGFEAWAAVANAVAGFEPVSILVDPSEVDRARRMLSAEITIVETGVGECWLRDHGPTFVVDDERPGVLGAVDWTFNGWGGHAWAALEHTAEHGRLVGELAGAEIVDSSLVAEGGGLHVDGEGTVLLTETVQLDPARNPDWTREQVEAEMARTVGATHAIWLPRGLTRDYADLGTNGHVDIVATMPSPGRLLLHEQRDAAHPDHAVTRELRALLERATDAAGRAFDIVNLPAPATIADARGPVDWSYVNHHLVDGGVIACGFGEPDADGTARGILAEAYPGREVVTIDARAIFAGGGGIHCITQQQPIASAA